MLDPSKPVEETFNLCPVHAADQLTEDDVLWMITNSLSTCLISTNTDLHEVCMKFIELMLKELSDASLCRSY